MSSLDREIHSADGKSYIEKVGEHRWQVVFNDILQGDPHTRREDARRHIRSLKPFSAYIPMPDGWNRFTRILLNLHKEEGVSHAIETGREVGVVGG